jgi:hypothetical protein
MDQDLPGTPHPDDQIHIFYMIEERATLNAFIEAAKLGLLSTQASDPLMHAKVTEAIGKMERNIKETTVRSLSLEEAKAAGIYPPPEPKPKRRYKRKPDAAAHMTTEHHTEEMTMVVLRHGPRPEEK